MLRRIVAIGLLLGLLALEPGGLSLCAMLSGMVGECATLTTKTTCDGMRAGQRETQANSQKQDCCQLSSAPFPVAQGKVSAPSPEVLKDHIVLLPGLVSFGANRQVRESTTVGSPPDLLPFLCTFLI